PVAATQAIVEGQFDSLRQPSWPAQIDSQSLLTIRAGDGAGKLPRAGLLVRDDLEIARPFLPLLARVEPAGEENAFWERAFFLRDGCVVENDVVDEQFGAGV